MLQETSFANGLWTEAIMSVRGQIIWKASEQRSSPLFPGQQEVLMFQIRQLQEGEDS